MSKKFQFSQNCQGEIHGLRISQQKVRDFLRLTFLRGGETAEKKQWCGSGSGRIRPFWLTRIRILYSQKDPMLFKFSRYKIV